MTSPPLDSTHGRTTLGVACHHRLWVAHTVKRRRPWHAIIAFGQHKWLNDVGRGIPSSLLCSTGGRMASGMTCNYRLWATQTFERCRLWYDITAHGLHAQSDDVMRGMTSPPLESTHGRTTSGVACHHRVWAAHTVKRRWAWHDIVALGLHAWSATSAVA